MAQRLRLEVEVDVRCESICSDDDVEIIGWKAEMDWTSSSQLHAARNTEISSELILPANGVLRIK